MSPVPPDEAIDARLRVWPVARLATLRDDGSPHLVPVVFAASDAALWIPVDGKPKRQGAGELERVRNLRRDPRAALLLDAYADDWSRLWWVHLEGRAAIRHDAEDTRFEHASAALRDKYPQYRETPLFRDEPTLIEFVASRRNAWCADLTRFTEEGSRP